MIVAVDFKLDDSSSRNHDPDAATFQGNLWGEEA